MEIFMEGQAREPSSLFFGVIPTNTLKSSAKSGGGQLTLLAPHYEKWGEATAPPSPCSYTYDGNSRDK